MILLKPSPTLLAVTDHAAAPSQMCEVAIPLHNEVKRFLPAVFLV